MGADHQVETVFTLADRASGPLKNIAGHMQMLQGQAQRANGGLERMLAPALGFVGLGLGVRSFAHKLFEVDEAARDVKSTITAAYIASDRFAHAGPGAALAASMKRGEQGFEALEDMATRGVAPLKVYADTYKNIALPALERTKLTQKDLLRFTEDLVPVLGAVTGNVQMAAFQAKQFGNILASGAGRPPKELLKVVGMTTKEFDKLRKKGVEPMFAEISKRIHENAPQFKALFEDPGVMFMRLRSTADQLFRILGQPVMEKLNEKAQELLKYVSENKKHVLEMAKLWGEKIAVGFDKAVSLAGFLKEHIGTIALAIAGIKFAPHILSGFQLLSKMSGGSGGFASGGSLFEKLGSGLTDLFDNKLPLFGSKIGETTNSLVTMIGKGPLVIAGLMALYEGLDWLAGEIDSAQKKSIHAKGEEMSGSTVVAQMRGKFGSSQLGVLKSVQQMGAISGGHIDVGKFGDRLMQMGVNQTSKDFAFAMKGVRALADALTPAEIVKMLFPSATEVAEKATSKPPQVNFNNNSFSIKQAFAEGFDPDRIAVAFTQDLVALGERKIMSSAFTPLGSMS